MKSALISLCALLASTPALAATISVSEAKSYVGQTVTVEGVVSEVHTSRAGDTFIDMGGRYPNEQFYGVIFSQDATKVSGVGDLSGKTVALTGTIQMYRGTPEIILR